MGKVPKLSKASQKLPLSIFTRLYDRLENFSGEVIPLQIGDTSVLPPEAARLQSIAFEEIEAKKLYAYSPPKGIEQLREMIVAKLRTENNMSMASAANVQITSGATHALSCAIRAVLDPGDELLVLSPHWPLINGIAASCSVKPVEVPFCAKVRNGCPTQKDLEQALEQYITPATAALYMSTPNNPDGFVYGEKEISAVAAVANRHNLWVVSDEVYESYIYSGDKHLSIATWPGMWEKTISAFSFSKTFGLAGLRLGYAVAPRDVAVSIQKMANTTIYSVPFVTQHCATRALADDEFVAATRADYQSRRDLAIQSISADVEVPMGSTYLFVDFSKWCEASDCVPLLERFADRGVLLAPGAAFGREYAQYARLCFTSVPNEKLVEGIQRINEELLSI